MSRIVALESHDQHRQRHSPTHDFTAAGHPPPRRRPRLGTFAVGTDAFVTAGFLPAMAGALHVSTATAGQSVSLFAGVYALASPLLAVATARLPRRTLLVAALVLLTAANALSALAPTYAVLLVGRVLAALGAAAFTPTAGRRPRRWCGPSRAAGRSRW
ncbi:hypothetical protein KCH_71920 [Kitasatospora cheerisanensis KCTC 2395]|uniref:Major facilitator superfamily (MFS) profile domain-containing protein n=1 Tax=Kitasatospora cheerisanensis KCTC 2395 TaxID=1348663 RepID=A0A066YHX7_9ACTN|nr:MFS transporter [Kitasatospora cheerisanensis]KDN81098.1 hypothetical protein KCH_71920 [Kitasatospora cheerisanensis KCTC 2395]